MKFWELKPEFRNPKQSVTVQNAWGVSYDCPQCKLEGRKMRIYTPLNGNHGWRVSNLSTSMYDVTITPSVRVNPGFHCLGHWNIVNGEVVFHPDSRCGERVKINLPRRVMLAHHGR